MKSSSFFIVFLCCVFSTSCQNPPHLSKPREVVLYKDEKTPVILPISASNPTDAQEIKEFLLTFIKPGDLVFDVGANIGKKTVLYLECGARVIGFEPQPDCVETLQAKFSGNPEVVIEPVGLGAQESSKPLFICTSAPTISTLSQDYITKSRFSKHGYKWDEKIMIQLTTLDQMIQKHGVPKFCKIDVENFELEVLKGLSQPIPLLSFECNTDQLENTKKCLDYLTALGYREFNFAFAERGLFLSSQWTDAEDLFTTIKTVMETHDFSSIWGLWGDIYARTEKMIRDDSNP